MTTSGPKAAACSTEFEADEMSMPKETATMLIMTMMATKTTKLSNSRTRPTIK